MNVSSSLERNYSRSACIVAGVGVLATGYFLGTIVDEFVESNPEGTLAAAEAATFTATPSDESTFVGPRGELMATRELELAEHR